MTQVEVLHVLVGQSALYILESGHEIGCLKEKMTLSQQARIFLSYKCIVVRNFL